MLPGDCGPVYRSVVNALARYSIDMTKSNRTASVSLLVLTLLSGCSKSVTPPKEASEPVVTSNAPAQAQPPSVQAQSSPDDLLQARLQAAIRESAQNRASRRSITGMLPIAPPAGRLGTTSVSGRLAPQLIQRTVRANFASLRRCYENGLTASPNLQGRIAIGFVIAQDGSVSHVTNKGTDLPNPATVDCVIKAFSKLSFPRPDGGIVTVVYPIHFTHSDSETPTPSRPSAAPSAPAVAAPNPLPSASVAPGVSPPVQIGSTYAPPVVVIDGSNVKMNGTVVGYADPIPGIGQTPMIDQLFMTLSLQRNDWKVKHPGETFAGVAGLRADPNTPLVIFKNTFQTIAFAGYPNIYVQSTSDPAKIVEFAAQVPGPPDPTAMGDSPKEPEPELHIEVLENDVALLWKQGFGVFAAEEKLARNSSALAALICQSWKVNGRRHEPTDIRQDALVIDADNALTLSAVTDIVQAAETCTRDVKKPNGSVEKLANFWVTFSMR